MCTLCILYKAGTTQLLNLRYGTENIDSSLLNYCITQVRDSSVPRIVSLTFCSVSNFHGHKTTEMF